MLNEYQVVSGGTVRLEIIDPAQNPDKEAEANQVYGIQPTPFQVTGRYEASVINSYFDILVQYGDQSETLTFNDLIEVEQNRDGTLDVRLRNLEYDLTSTIKKVIYGFQNIDAILASLEEPVRMNVFITPDTLPPELADVPGTFRKVLSEIEQEAGGTFSFEFIDPDDPNSEVTRAELQERYNLQPLMTSFFSGESYYLYMVMETGDQAQVIYPSGQLSEADIRNSVESALKRLSPGFLQVVGLWTPPAAPTQNMFGQTQQPISSWQQVREVLQQEYEVRTVDLSTGSVGADVDVLVVIGPQNLDDKARYAIDQYLMRGGAVILAAGTTGIMAAPTGGGLAAKPVTEGVGELLAHYGITVEDAMVLDPQNEPFPVPVMRQVGDFQVQEIQALDYPFFIDIRADGMAEDHPIVNNLPAVTLNWASPIKLDAAKNAERDVDVLLQSSSGSWIQESDNIQPDFNTYPELGFAQLTESQPYTLAVSVRGSFASFFTDKPSPLAVGEEDGETAESEQATPEPTPQTAPGTIEVSPETARLVVVSSFEFVDDTVLELSRTLGGDRYLNNLNLVQNAVAWAVEDLDLLNISARGSASRVLIELSEGEQSFWEVGNYVFALLALLTVAAVTSVRRRNETPLPLVPREEVDPRYTQLRLGRKSSSSTKRRTDEEVAS
jgi:ABC-2 type transport system permease protein